MSREVFLIIDLHNGGILHHARSREVMVALLEGIGDAIAYQTFHDLMPARYKDFDFSNDLLFLSPLDRELHLMPESLVTPAFEKRRDLAKDKARQIFKLQMICEAARDTISLGVPAEIYADIEFELGRCRPDDSHFTPAIHDYASNVGCSPASAFDELRMRSDSARIQRIRNYAIYRKFLGRIYLTESSGMKALFADVHSELFLNSHV
ncbi:hypothetical protein BH10BDE1_BH10BDE1_08030 [soil metagenome]